MKIIVEVEEGNEQLIDQVIDLNNCVELFVSDESTPAIVVLGVDGEQHKICEYCYEKGANEDMRKIVEAWQQGEEWYKL